MSHYRGSISLRLAAGFALVLGVLGVVLLLALNHLGKVRKANERLAVYLEVRRQAVQVGMLAEELAVLHSRLLTREGIDWETWGELEYRCYQLSDLAEPIQARFLDNPEGRYVEQLAGAIVTLRGLFRDQAFTVRAETQVDNPLALPMPEFIARSRQMIDYIGELSGILADSFDVRMLQAREQANYAWTITIATAKIVFPIALLVSLLVIYYTHRSILRPVGSLLKGTQALAGGDLSNPIQVNGSGEFTELADSFNRMAQALEANQKRLVEAEKLASVGRLAAGVAHEINNPITVIMGYARMLLASLEDDTPEKEQLRNIAEEAQQCKDIVNSLLDLSRPSDPTPGEVLNPSEVMAEVLGMAHALQLTEGVQIEESVIDRPLALNIGRSRLRQLALNIIRNALEVLQRRRDGRLSVEGYIRPREKLEEAVLADAVVTGRSFLIFVFTDNGPGIPSENLSRLFEPFFTTKADGMGLGLAICYNIARAHGGFIHAQSDPGKGSTFTVGLPLVEEE